ncbi:glycosyltransferase family 4 protein [bacterium]|nr:glycosyltransferase family 4 protein [bacterium]
MSDKPKVLHIITKMVACGGASLTAKLLAEHQASEQSAFEPALAYGLGTEEEEEALSVAGSVEQFQVASLVRPLRPLQDWRALGELREVIRSYRPAVVHTHSSKAGVLGRLAARKERVPVIVHHVHGWSFHDRMPAWERNLFVGIERYMARRCHGLLMVAREDQRIAAERSIGASSQWHMVRSGLRMEEFAPTDPERREAARRALGIDEGRFVVGTVAQLRPQKSPLDFVKVAKAVTCQHEDALFVWIGDGPMRGEVEMAIAQEGLGERLRLVGSRTDVRDLYPAFDVFLLTSLWEGLPRTVVEASVVGLPVVATAVAGTAEAIRDGHSGLLAEPGDVAGLTSCILRLYEDPALRRGLCAHAQAMREEFSIERVVADLEGLYLSLLSEGKGGQAAFGTAGESDP